MVFHLVRLTIGIRHSIGPPRPEGAQEVDRRTRNRFSWNDMTINGAEKVVKMEVVLVEVALEHLSSV
jgi:hypothetical protein